MTDKEVKVPKAAPRGGGIKLGKPSRAVAFVLGTTGLGAGGAAVYLTQLEAGPVGLMTVGLIFMIIALGGILPTRLKIGEGEAEWQAAAGEVIETAVEAAPPTVRAELIDQLGSLAEVAPQAALPALSGLAYEQLIEQIIQARLPEIPAARTLSRSITLETSGRTWEFDLAIEIVGGPMLLIEVKATPRLYATNIAIIADKLQRYREATSKPAAALLVTRYPLPGAARWKLDDEPHVYAVVVRGREDGELLVAAISRVLANEQGQ